MIDDLVYALVEYGIREGLTEPDDREYVTSRLLEVLSLSSYKPNGGAVPTELSEILSGILDYAAEAGLLPHNTVVYRDLFDTKIMGCLMPPPSVVNGKFYSLYSEDPALATDWYYGVSVKSNYIRRDRIEKDIRWSVCSEYGDIDLSINLSKPEKDPAAIAAAKLLPQTDYPPCLLCHENEGFAGTLSKPARQNLRQIPFDMAGEKWFLQYSPYVYYNEHCIALSSRHTPMKIDALTFKKLLSFVTCFPHYFIGSNADLPIVGGSILSHDHMQGGRYTFPMERAGLRREVSFVGFSDVSAGIVAWPMSVLRLRSSSAERLSLLAGKILAAWRIYSDPERQIFAFTDDGEPHNTITPIARRRGDDYELDLVLRNNITTPEHPMGLYHPHAEYHNIKKENIGLIEVMGLAVLPARLKGEMELLKRCILDGTDPCKCPETEKHSAWLAAFRDSYSFTEDNVEDILKKEIGKTFVRVLSDAGVLKDDENGRAGMLKFVEFVNNN